ncbi:TPA: hypothetical protein PXP39_003550 [Yersinia enterocolitica]|nr:hypothetical protein [Yersinia enterocolitica]HDL7833626.1 hypothetical protein [Yersinia enterocolitica]HDL7874310.1 hypothetical protein [Yersinia enterocolitica]HDL7886868.1 hypothetical protein [Yersinia enterocolitica]HDL7895177.1 hypothetical protein [Yersinia enterocolitica]
MKIAGWVALVIMAFVLALYLAWFGLGFSNKTEAWGQFGDYFGGVLNPILTFTSVILLIRSIDLQREANNSLIIENKRQEKLEKRKDFEFRFYNLIDSQKKLFDDFYILAPGVNGDITYNNSAAVDYIEEIILTSNQRGIIGNLINGIISNLDSKSNDQIYSSVRKFYLAIKLIDIKITKENGFEEKDRKEYFETLINFSDLALVRLIMISIKYMNWPNILYIKNCNEFMCVLTEVGLDSYMSEFK